MSNQPYCVRLLNLGSLLRVLRQSQLQLTRSPDTCTQSSRFRSILLSQKKTEKTRRQFSRMRKILTSRWALQTLRKRKVQLSEELVQAVSKTELVRAKRSVGCSEIHQLQLSKIISPLMIQSKKQSLASMDSLSTVSTMRSQRLRQKRFKISLLSSTSSLKSNARESTLRLFMKLSMNLTTVGCISLKSRQPSVQSNITCTQLNKKRSSRASTRSHPKRATSTASIQRVTSQSQPMVRA